MLSLSYWLILYITGTRPWPRPQSISISCATNPPPLEQCPKKNESSHQRAVLHYQFLYLFFPPLRLLFVSPKTFLLTRQTYRNWQKVRKSTQFQIQFQFQCALHNIFLVFLVYCHLFYVYSFSLPISLFLVYSKKRSWITPAVQIFQ